MAGHAEVSATVAFARRRRLEQPPVPAGEIAIAAPPGLPGPQRGAILRLLPVAMAVPMAALLVVSYRSGHSVGHGPAVLAFPVMMLASAVATVLSGRVRRQGADIDADRDDYLNYLVDLRSTVANTVAAQRLSLAWQHPPPQTLWQLAGGPRMWERQPGDADFGAVRVGVGSAPLAARLVAPAIGGITQVDPVTAAAVRRFVETYATVPDAPITIGLFDRTAMCLGGDQHRARGILRAMICQLAVLHGPDRILVAAVAGSHHLHHWQWLKWLPHHQHPAASDTAGPARMMYPTLAAAGTALAALAVQRHVLVIVDGGVVDGAEPILTGSRTADTSIVVVGTGGAVPADALRLRVTETALAVCGSGTHDGDEVLARPDRLGPVEALVCARRLAGYRSADAGSASRRWADLIGIADVTRFDPGVAWAALKPADRLRVPIGTVASGQPVFLDIKEAAENGMGPHGLCIGATGSGKSEFLRTLVLGMMARHSPAVLNLVLVDFKGGATFLGMRRSPHVAAVITNLADEAPLVERMRAALAGELNRRQEILRAAGNFVSVAAYDEARRAGRALPPLPALFVIVDEFSELLSQQPDFVEMFVAIGRLGRSLGVHLLLASQRLDEGRLRGLESHLSYRVCLKTLSANESRAVLGVPDAHELPNTPGTGYLHSATGELVRFHTAFVSGSPAMRPTGDAPAVQRFSATPNGPVLPAPGLSAGGPTLLQTVLDQLSGQGPPARQVWLPLLAESPTLGGLLTREPQLADLVVPIGIVDRPFEQRRTPLRVDLRGAAGNVVVVGAPQSGKSTALAALVTALAATHGPTRVQLYCLDFGGGALASLQTLPQVGAVAGRGNPELVRRTISELVSIVRRREALFGERGIGSMKQYRQLLAERDPICDDDRFGDVFLVIDGWAGLCGEFDALESPIVALAASGLSFGVHVVVSASRWAEIRPGLRDQLGTRIELRLGDPADSELDRRQAAQVPRDRPGRALIDGGLHALIARPQLDGVKPVPAGRGKAPPVPLLPAVVPRGELVEAIAGADAYPLLGVEESGLNGVAIDFSRQSHLLIYGDNECGKTSTLRVLCRELVRTRTAAQAQLILVDYRRSLLDAVEPDQLSGYAISAVALSALLPELLDRLAGRMPGPEVTRRQLRDRSWWSGPDLYLLVDDYDVVATAAGNPLTPLLEYLPHASDLGLHLVVARRSGGAARAVYEPLLAALRDLGSMGLIMSGDPDEGPLIGAVRPVPLPPGRGTLVTRAGGAQLIQVAWSPP